LFNQTTGDSLPSLLNLMTHPWNIYNYPFRIQWSPDTIEAQIAHASAAL
jgi:hypothetical protein